jgi:putative ATP-binding cassette transporter
MLRGIAEALRAMWALAVPYFRSEERWSALVLLGAIVTIELGIVAITVLLNHWNVEFYNALQERNFEVFAAQLAYFSVLAGAFVLAAVLQYYLNQWLQIRWRRWATERYLEAWLADGAHYRQKMAGEAADNPDQRIAEDVKLFIAHTLSIGLELLNAVVTLASFVVILWGLSAAAPLVLGGAEVAIPGYLVWAALAYAVVGTAVTHLVGRKLIPLNFQQERYEADFRFALVRLRENSEQIALQRGEGAERGPLRDRFANLIRNFMALVGVQKNVVLFRAVYNQTAVVLPFVMAAPAYFGGKIQLGQLMQISSAFDSVRTALSVFVTVYARLAEWKAVVDRLSGFERAIAAARDPSALPSRIVVEAGAGDRLEVDGLAVARPDGREIVALDRLALAPGERRIVSGPSGSGKTTLLRGLSGVWPWGRGRIGVPRGTRLLVLPQRPYLPLGSLRAALAYPAASDAFPDADVRGALDAVGLPALAGRLDEDENWAAILSGGEQQRVQLARAFLHRPDWLLLDEATSALDAAAEKAVTARLLAALPRTGILAISHRPAGEGFAPEPVRIAPASQGGPALATA